MTTNQPAGRQDTVRCGAVWLLAMIALAAPLLATALEVTDSSREAVTLSLELPAPAWRPGVSNVAGEAAWDAVLPGFVATATPGQVRLPRRGWSLVVPPGTRPRLEVVRETWRDLDGRRLAFELVPVMERDPETGDVVERPLVLTDQTELPRDRVPATVLADLRNPDVVPPTGPAVRLGEPSWWRGRRVVTVQVIPVRDDGDGRAARALASGAWRVRFVPDDRAAKALPTGTLRRHSSKGDARFARHFLNGDLLAALPTEAAARGLLGGAKARAAASGTPLGYPDVRLPVARTQLYRVRASELVAAGLMPGGGAVDVSQLRLYQRRYAAELDDPASDIARPYVEVEVPIHVVGDGAFDGDDLFLFWGLRPADDGAFTVEQDGVVYDLGDAGDADELFNESNAYWLQYADPDQGEPWSRMEDVTLPAASGTPLASYSRTDRLEEALAYRQGVPSINVDRYYFNSYRASSVSLPFTLRSPVPGQDGAVLRLGMANFSAVVRTMALELRQGGTTVLELPPFQLDATHLERIYSYTLPASILELEGLSLHVSNASGSPFMFAYVDWLRFDYQASYAAPVGRLLFPGGDEDVALGNLEIPGFPDDELGVIEITDPREPRLVALTGANQQQAGGSLTLSLQIDQSAGQREFYAATRMFSTGVSDIPYDEAEAVEFTAPPTQLTGSEADVLVVAHPEFTEQVAEWVTYRQSRDPELDIHVVEPQTLYDWYSGGLKNPWAIKRLVNHGLESPTWGTWALLLVGDANENPRELGVPSAGDGWSRDWVPTHFHVQSIGQNLEPEVLASDEWFGYPYAGDELDFPEGNNVTDVPSLYIGRIPCNSPEEFARVLTKIQQVESDDGNQPWRRRGLFISDDAWSSGTLNAEGFTLAYRRTEVAFEQSENEVLAQAWLNNAGMVPLTPDTVMLRPFMEPLHPDDDDVVTLTEARAFCEESDATEVLVNAFNAGGTLAHFQGHANHWLFAHESWFVDDRRSNYRTDVDLLTNVGRPWLFCGMGCHLGDFIQNVAGGATAVDPNLGEKFLVWSDGGSVATYGSSGYEFLSSNKLLSELFIQNFMIEPPAVAANGEEIGTRWLLGEIMWRAEKDVLAANQSSNSRAMVYQYTILGDPLLQLDAGPPVVEAMLAGSGPLAPEGATELVAVDATNQRVVTLQARDEAGIDRLLVRDSEGNDLTASVVEATPYYDDGRTHIMDYVITLPVRPFAHDLTIDVYDAADRLDTDHHPSFTLSVDHEFEALFTADGVPVDPASYVFTVGEPVDFTVTVTSAAWLGEDTVIEAEGENLEISGFTATVLDSDHLEVALTATALEAKADRGVRLMIDGFETYVPLEQSDVASPGAGITGLVNFPNPMREATRFLFGTSLHGGQGKVRVWTVSGRHVAEVPFALAGGGQEVVAWNGRDREGDRLANGTYLYRIEIDGSAGHVRSDMQRLVIMR